MKTLKKLASCLFAIMLGASLMAAPAAAAFADEASDAAAAADSISQTPNVTTDALEGETESETTNSAETQAQATGSNIVSTDATIQASIANGSRVLDEYGLLSDTEVAQLNAMAPAIESTYGVAPFYVTVRSLQGLSNATDYTDEYTAAYGLDGIANNGCIVFLVCLDAGLYSLTSYGECADTFDETTLEYLSTDLFPYLGRGDWAGAGETFFGDVSQTLAGGKANATSDVAYNGTYVTDAYGLFSDTQRATLEAKATELAQKYQMGVYLLIVDKMDGLNNPTSAQRTNFATSFYRANDLGLGSGKDGVMLVIAVDSRDYVTIAYGQGSYSFSDEGISYMESAVTDELGSNDWYAGCEAYYDKIGEQLEYYDAKGEPWTEPDLLSLALKILAILGIPFVSARAKVKSEEDAMHTAREKTEASNYLIPGSFVLTEKTDSFSYTSHTVIPIPQHESSGGGGGGGSFGGGGWGGGGGGGFSSSGGGKF